MRERARDVMSDHRRSRSESSVVLDDLLRIAKQHEELYPLMLSTLKRYGDIFEREMDVYVPMASFHFTFTLIVACRQLKLDLFTVLDKFVEQAALLDDLYVYHCSRRHSYSLKLLDSDDNWCAFLKRFTDSVQHITGQIVDVRLASEADHSLLQDEIDQLRGTVDKLTTEVRT